MADISPNSVIKILSGVPLDPTYDHTIYFATKTDQLNYFDPLTNSKVKYSFQNNTYQRVNSGVLRVARCADDLYDCNYLMFQNTAFGNKWFYCFIKSVNYINNAVSEITYEIDVMQTWMFDYSLEMCFVEREHSVTDELFENITPENIEIGDEYVCKDKSSFDMNNMYVGTFVNRKTSGSSGTTATSTFINNTYMPVRVGAGISASDVSSIDAYLDQFVEDDIIAVFQYPTFMGDILSGGSATEEKTITHDFVSLLGYTPKNKKLFSFPYNMVFVSNNCGDSAVFRWEDWDENFRGKFEIIGTFITTPAAMCYPTNYRHIPKDVDSGIVYRLFPQCAWSGDAFKAWWAQNKNGVITNGVTSVIGSLFQAGSALGASSAATVSSTGVIGGAALAGASVASGGIAAAGMAIGAGITIANTLAKIEDIKNAPHQMHGHTQNDGINSALGKISFDFYLMCIKPEYAEIVDDYFDRFGYATRLTKIPNISSRPHWNYVKTIGCTITGSVPADTARKICSIYDNGITFWKNGSEVGNYALDNKPVATVEEVAYG